MGRTCSVHGEARSVCTVFVLKPARRSPRRPKCRWKDDTKMCLREIVLGVWTGFICSV
jgi:hypothetical protein